ncbi:MAG: acyl-CoA dehydrogenase family protein [Acidimicrobiales bacterium]|nr:acyl-CoA dehydrogenase family protein [Acidimicrobiales bacterium]
MTDAEDLPASFAKPLFCGEIHEDLVFPYPRQDADDARKVDSLLGSLDEATADYDPRAVEEAGWLGDEFLADLGQRGLLGLTVPEEYGGQGLSQTGYARVAEQFGVIDATLAVVMGVHQSIGTKPLLLYGTDAQKQRWLPDLAAGRKLAAFALTEPNAGSDAYHLETWAERQSDGSWRLDGEKRYIGNGSKDLLTVFARSDEGHVAFLVEGGSEGLIVGDRYDTMGLRGNDLRHLRFDNLRVPAGHMLGEPGDGFHVATETLNTGRLSLGTGAVGATKKMLGLVIDHVHEREQFGQPLADFELVEEKISWMATHLFGLESLSYLATGMVDAGVEDVSLESAMAKISGTEFIWYAANRVFQLAGGVAYMRDQPYEKILRDIRIFPIFEGANDVLRAFVALSGLKSLGDELEDLASLDLRRPIASLGVVTEYTLGRIERTVRPDRITKAHAELAELSDPITDQVQRLRDVSTGLLREHGEDIKFRQWHQKRLAHAAMDIYGQVATLSRITQVFDDQGLDASSPERYIAETFCRRAHGRVMANLDHVEHNDDDRMHAIARIAYRDAR